MSSCWRVPPEIGRLWNLQTFITTWGSAMDVHFTEQIWELMGLRHLRLDRFYLPNPPSVSVDEERYAVFANIQTIFGLSPSCCTKEVISGILNIKKLGICGNEDDYRSFQESRLFNNLVHLHQLEILSFELKSDEFASYERVSPAMSIPSAKVFPATLKKLKLYRTCLMWEELNIIGKLPNLAVLKLIHSACRGKEWYPVADGFTRLKLLIIDFTNLKYWKATNDSFPVLEHLVISSCSYLEEIPIEFAEINSLKLIELQKCTLKVAESAARIQQEQEDLGNKPVDVRIL